MKVRLAEQGGAVVGGTAADFAKVIAEDTEKWAKVVKFAGVKASLENRNPATLKWSDC
jgi:hypothetical protein